MAPLRTRTFFRWPYQVVSLRGPVLIPTVRGPPPRLRGSTTLPAWAERTRVPQRARKSVPVCRLRCTRRM